MPEKYRLSPKITIGGGTLLREIHDYDRFYEILELAPGAAPDEIQQAYRKLVPAIHPDLKETKYKDFFTQKMKILNAARDELNKYWQTHKAPPPTKKSKIHTKQQKPQQPSFKAPSKLTRPWMRLKRTHRMNRSRQPQSGKQLPADFFLRRPNLMTRACTSSF